MKKIAKQTFWVTNASAKNVTLSDLALNIKAFTTVNLLDEKHYHYTLEQLNKSKECGSIFNKKDKIKVHNIAPTIIDNKKIQILQEHSIPTRTKSIFSIKEVEYDELKVSEDKELQKKMDEEYAKENAELVDTNSLRPITSQKV